MIDVIADLHLHSQYSRAVSPQMVLPEMQRVAIQKGIDVLATGDWTHPLWMKEIRNQLEEAGEGLYSLKSEIRNSKFEMTSPQPSPEKERESKEKTIRFLLSVEISCIYSQGGKGRRVHSLVMVPSFETAEKVNKELSKRGCNLTSDGRPIIGLSSKNLLELILEIDERSLLIPAHIWTPWFGIYGQQSGFESLSEAFGELDKYVYAIETGLSSDPEMNWQMKELETRSILSFSDAHSLAKMGREATIFQLEELSYEAIRQAIMQPMERKALRVNSKVPPSSRPSPIKEEGDQGKTLNRVLYTIEFYPEEGKYHYSGHRNCGVIMTPDEQMKQKSMCPVCHRKLTDGVMRRVAELSQETSAGWHQKQEGLVWIKDPKNIHPPFVKIVPLNEIIAEAIGSRVSSQKVRRLLDGICAHESELAILLKLPLGDIKKRACAYTSEDNAIRLTEGIQKVREENIVIQPGYDGVYGTVNIWSGGVDMEKDTDEGLSKKEQIGLEF